MSNNIEFTGEFMVPGMTGDRIEADHYARYRFAESYVGGKRVLDAACGTGYASEILRKAGARSYKGVDINPVLAKHGTDVWGKEKVTFEEGDVTKLTFSEEFDVITCFETIEHVAQYKKAIERLKAALVPGGTLLISSPNRLVTTPKTTLTDPPGNKFHTQEFTVDELVNILKDSGFDVAPDARFGQRQHVVLFWRIIKRIARLFSQKINGPEHFSSPNVTSIRWKTPRYFLIVATKKL